jgi:hypothetical protein
VSSGTEVSISHTWTERGTYEIKVKAMDEHGKESDWGTLSVTMPLNLQMSKSNNQLRLIFFVPVQYSGLLPGVNYFLKGVQNSGLDCFPYLKLRSIVASSRIDS